MALNPIVAASAARQEPKSCDVRDSSTRRDRKPGKEGEDEVPFMKKHAACFWLHVVRPACCCVVVAAGITDSLNFSRICLLTSSWLNVKKREEDRQLLMMSRNPFSLTHYLHPRSGSQSYGQVHEVEHKLTLGLCMLSIFTLYSVCSEKEKESSFLIPFSRRVINAFGFEKKDFCPKARGILLLTPISDPDWYNVRIRSHERNYWLRILMWCIIHSTPSPADSFLPSFPFGSFPSTSLSLTSITLSTRSCHLLLSHLMIVRK